MDFLVQALLLLAQIIGLIVIGVLCLIGLVNVLLVGWLLLGWGATEFDKGLVSMAIGFILAVIGWRLGWVKNHDHRQEFYDNVQERIRELRAADGLLADKEE